MKYIVKATCFYQNRFYKKGEVVEFSTTSVPSHFARLEPDVKATEDAPQTDAAQPKKKKAKRYGQD